MNRILVTGGAGFIGSHLVRRLVRGGLQVSVLDAFTYAGRRENLDDLGRNGSLRIEEGDIANAEHVARAAAGCDAIVNVAAETHVDRSIFGGDEFIRTNVLGTKRLLDWVREHPGTRFLQVSTDEVYGDVPSPRRSHETDALAGSSPYAASKAGADLLVLSYVRTFGIDATITRGANTYGPFQFPEKLIPLFITNALDGIALPLYGDGLQEREMLFVDDHVAALELVLHQGVPGKVYNVGPEQAQTNLETARLIVAAIGVDPALVTPVADRPGHDRRYAVDASRIRALGWRPQVAFDAGLRATVDWFVSNRAWWAPIKASAAFGEYASRNYGVGA